jgi:hypothetical protein
MPPRSCLEGDLLEFAEKLKRCRAGRIIHCHIKTSNQDWPCHPAVNPLFLYQTPRIAHQTILPYSANISFEISMIAATASLILLSSLGTLKISLNNLKRKACQYA